jgi:pimeloyl-ACP methyl ester carboxylesterase
MAATPARPARTVGDALALRVAAAHDVDWRALPLCRSLGSGVAVHLAAERRLAGVVLVTPYDSLRAVAARHYPYAPVALLLKHPFDSLLRAPRILTPLLVLTAEHDRIVPPTHARVLFEHWRGAKTWRQIARADHNDLDADPDYWNAIAVFLAERARADAGRATDPDQR